MILEISCQEVQNTCLTYYLRKEKEGGDSKNGFKIHYLTNLDFFDRADDHGDSVSKYSDDLRGDNVLRDKAPGKEHSLKNNRKEFQNVKSDFDVFVLAFKIGNS